MGEGERESCETRASVRAGRKRECEGTHQLKSAPIDDFEMRILLSNFRHRLKFLTQLKFPRGDLKEFSHLFFYTDFIMVDPAPVSHSILRSAG